MKIIKELNEKSESIKFDGKNFNDIKDFVSKSGFDVELTQHPNGKIEMNGKTIFKDDILSFDRNGIHVYKPSYVIN